VITTRRIRTICHGCWILRIPAVLLFVAGLTGCNTCVTFTSNPPMGTLGIVSSDPKPVCMLPKVTSAVRLHMSAEPVCSSCGGSGHVQHIFLAIRSIELNSSATASDDSSDWQELLPAGIEQNPAQIDLMEGMADQAVQAPFGKAALVPAGIYRQLRLRLVPSQPAVVDRLPEKNACGRGTFNCIVTADGTIHPLQIDPASSALQITADNMEGAALPFLPDTDTDLIIEWKLVWEWSSSADDGIRLFPTLAGSAKVHRIKLDELGTPDDGVVNDSQSR
jgi:hypothetical protein